MEFFELFYTHLVPGLCLLPKSVGELLFPHTPLLPAALARTSLVRQRLEPPPESAWGFPPHPPGRSVTCTTRKLLNAISRMRGDHQRYGGTVMFFPDLSRQVMLCAMSGMSESSEASGSVRALPASRIKIFPFEKCSVLCYITLECMIVSKTITGRPEP